MSKEDKLLREKLAYKFLEAIDPEAGARFWELWNEYENNQTEAAMLVHDADKFQRLDLAFRYAKQYPELDFSDFKTDATNIRNSQMKEDAQQTLREWNDWQCSSRDRMYIFVVGTSGIEVFRYHSEYKQAALEWAKARNLNRQHLLWELPMYPQAICCGANKPDQTLVFANSSRIASKALLQYLQN